MCKSTSFNLSFFPTYLSLELIACRSAWYLAFTVNPEKPPTPEIFLKCYCFPQKSQSGVRKLNHKQDQIFAVIGHTCKTTNIPEIFQVFMVFPVAL